MKKQDKELLIKDLCARLPYGVQGASSEFEGNISPLLTKGEADWDILTELNYRIEKHGWRPYLRTMSSMTKEEIRIEREIQQDCFFGRKPLIILTDFYNSRNLDVNGLIEKGLAIERPKDMYNF